MLGKIKMTTVIMSVVVGTMLASILVVSAALYVNLRSQSVAAGRAQQHGNVGVAATILETAGSSLRWADDGGVARIQTHAIPTFKGTQIVEAITRVTRQVAAIYVVDAAGALKSSNTSLIGNDGKSLAGDQLDAGAASQVLGGAQYLGQLEIGGVEYYAAIQPIVTKEDQVLGAILVGTTAASLEASANEAIWLILAVGGAVTVAMAVLGFIFSRAVARPIPMLATAMNTIAGGDYQTVVPYASWSNEVGDMARSVEVFRKNSLRVSELTEAEADRILRDEQQRRTMLGELQGAFGRVVVAATQGDFSKRVETEFADPELNTLADSVNDLVGTFDRGLAEVGHVLDAMAGTDFTRRMNGKFAGAFAQLQTDVNSVADTLAAVVGRLRLTSGTLKTATGEILSGANDLSERTTRQAATIEETTAAMEQLATTVLANADRARRASDDAIKVSRAADEGGKVMEQATLAMERITRSSAQISNIIGMIDDIAFQTNLLALNASVEAARAGEAGKGFAVVAIEVRRLAQSAANASSEVKGLIEQSGNEVGKGSELVDEAAKKLREMIDAIRSATGSMEAIARDSAEQAAAIEEVSAAVRIMDEMTQHNAALVEETNAAIEQTEAQANELDRAVEVFRVDEASQAKPIGHVRGTLRAVSS